MYAVVLATFSHMNLTVKNFTKVYSITIPFVYIVFKQIHCLLLSGNKKAILTQCLIERRTFNFTTG